jgi:transcriptional regulator with XRE-family HTH domain
MSTKSNHLAALQDSGTRAFREWRTRHGLSLTAAAEALAMSRRMVAYYCSGDKPVPSNILLACKGWEATRLTGDRARRSANEPRTRDHPDSHDVAEQSKLLAHRYYALRIRETPTLLVEARNDIKRAVQSGVATIGQQLWDQVLSRGPEAVLGIMLEDSERGRLMRSNSPFSRIIGVHDPKARSELWRQAKRELSAQRTSNAASLP